MAGVSGGSQIGFAHHLPVNRLQGRSTGPAQADEAGVLHGLLEECRRHQRDVLRATFRPALVPERSGMAIEVESEGYPSVRGLLQAAQFPHR